MDWSKHDFGPGTITCARCLGPKPASRLRSKWCRACDDEVSNRRKVTGGLDKADPIRAPRRVDIYRGRR